MAANFGTALVTGASSGIGEAYAHALAQRGYDLILVARREERLQHVATAIQEATGQLVNVVTADLATEEGIGKIEGAIAARPDIRMLVNNAGFGTTGSFVEVDSSRQKQMLRVHIDAVVRLTRAALPAMLKARQGQIINVSSISSYLPAPNRTLYGGTKSFINYFSRCLQIELAKSGVHVQAIVPGFTYSGFHDTDEFEGWSRSTVPQKLWMTSEEVVSISLNAMGKKRVMVIPGWRNQLLVALGSNPLTRGIITLLMKIVFRKKG